MPGANLVRWPASVGLVRGNCELGSWEAGHVSGVCLGGGNEGEGCEGFCEEGEIGLGAGEC